MANIRSMDFHILDSIFGMGSGYVLNFSDRTMAQPRATEWDRYQREFNVQVIGYRDHAQVPSILDELARAAAP